MHKYVVELIATFFLVALIGLCTALGLAGDLDPFAIGIGLAALTYMGAHVSGAHYNPAVTLAIYIRGRCSGREVLPYMLAQFLGAAVAAFVVRGVFAGHVQINSATVEIARWIPGASGPIIASELLFSYLLIFVFLNVTTSRGTAHNPYFGLAIGGTVLAGLLAVGQIAEGAFNPAVTLGLAVTGRLAWADSWMYLLPQILGAVLAAFSFRALHPEDK